MSGVLLALVLAAPVDTEEEAWSALVARFAQVVPEPEPPPGLRAPPETERHARAVAAYAKEIAAWRAAEAERRERLAEDCGRFLARYPGSAHGPGVLYMRGASRFRSGRHAEARVDLEAFLAAGPSGADAEAARTALVASCRALGDYRAALRHAPDAAPDLPDLMEEAGEVDRAIAAAESAGDRAKAAGWRRIGNVFPGDVRIPKGAAAIVVEAGVDLPLERKEALRLAFGAEKVEFLGCPAEQKGLYVLDGGGIIRSVNPRFDTLQHRITQLASSAK